MTLEGIYSASSTPQKTPDTRRGYLGDKRLVFRENPCVSSRSGEIASFLMLILFGVSSTNWCNVYAIVPVLSMIFLHPSKRQVIIPGRLLRAGISTVGPARLALRFFALALTLP